MQKRALIISGAIFFGVGLLHLARALSGLRVIAGNFEIPVWTSWFGTSVCFVLALWMWNAARR
jgi:hypothetical protein